MILMTNILNAWRGWQKRVATAGDLPNKGILGEVRLVIDEKKIYFWNGTAWEATATGGGSSSNSFSTIQTDTGTSPVASSPTDTLTLTSSDNSLGVDGDSTTDTIDLKVDPTKGDLATALGGKQNNLGYTPENQANKATNLTTPDNTKYPTTLAVSNALSGKQDSLSQDQIDQFDEDFDQMDKARTNKDGTVYKTITWTDRTSGNTRKTSILSGGSTPNFTTRTVTIYEPDGVTIRSTEVFTQQYSGPDWIGET